jgi:predicted component of type VI protein secretion system
MTVAPRAVRPLLLVAALVLVGCSADDEQPEVRPIDDVLATEVTVEPDAAGTSATLTVDSTIPLACAVVYGTDDSFGLIATDDDMAGGAHTDHQPTMLGLAPGTTYRYRLQGSDPAGNLYASQVMEFTTPEAPELDRPGPNVAPNASVAAVSSEFSDQFAAALALDGDPATEWSSDGDGDEASLTVDLGGPTELVGVGARTRTMGDGSSIVRSFTLTLDDGTELGPFEAGDGLLAVTAFGRPVTTTTVRFDAVDTTGGNTGLVDLELYASR